MYFHFLLFPDIRPRRAVRAERLSVVARDWRDPHEPASVSTHSLFDSLFMKAQLRLAGGRRKLGRNGLTSDIPRECADPPEYLRDLRDQMTEIQARN